MSLHYLKIYDILKQKLEKMKYLWLLFIYLEFISKEKSA